MLPVKVANVVEKQEKKPSNTMILLNKYMGSDSFVIPVGCFVTAAILGSGLNQLRLGNKPGQQIFMRCVYFCSLEN